MDPQKNNFWGFFQRFFGQALPLPIVDVQMFCQMEGLMKIHNRGKFHLHSICSSQVINFQKFLVRWSIQELGHFGRGVLGPNSLKNGSILVRLAPEVAVKERNKVLKFF